jgi:hypothetical protein
MANEEHVAILKQGVKAWNQWKYHNTEIRPDLSSATLVNTDLTNADFSDVNLRWAILTNANLTETNLSRARLGGTVLRRANLFASDLRGARLVVTDLGSANLNGVNLRGASLINANLDGADFSHSKMVYTQLADLDLGTAIGLETIMHDGPSTIGIDTILKSKSKIPEVFLRGAGVPEEFIAYMKSLVANPIEFHSCFISYSSKDQRFAEQLHSDLQSRNVRCWFAPHDMPIGGEIRTEIEKAIHLQEKLLIVLSENSVESAWVKKEVETAFEKEQKQNRLVLFPIRLDEAVMKTELAWAADIRRMRNIGDFAGWKHDDKYAKAFERLMRDLKTAGSVR